MIIQIWIGFGENPAQKVNYMVGYNVGNNGEWRRYACKENGNPVALNKGKELERRFISAMIFFRKWQERAGVRFVCSTTRPLPQAQQTSNRT